MIIFDHIGPSFLDYIVIWERHRDIYYSSKRLFRERGIREVMLWPASNGQNPRAGRERMPRLDHPAIRDKCPGLVLSKVKQLWLPPAFRRR